MPKSAKNDHFRVHPPFPHFDPPPPMTKSDFPPIEPRAILSKSVESRPNDPILREPPFFRIFTIFGHFSRFFVFFLQKTHHVDRFSLLLRRKTLRVVRLVRFLQRKKPYVDHLWRFLREKCCSGPPPPHQLSDHTMGGGTGNPEPWIMYIYIYISSLIKCHEGRRTK